MNSPFRVGFLAVLGVAAGYVVVTAVVSVVAIGVGIVLTKVVQRELTK